MRLLPRRWSPRDRSRFVWAVSASLLLHAFLLVIHLDSAGVGIPGLDLPWKQRRLQAQYFNIVLAPPPAGRVPEPVLHTERHHQAVVHPMPLRPPTRPLVREVGESAGDTSTITLRPESVSQESPVLQPQAGTPASAASEVTARSAATKILVQEAPSRETFIVPPPEASDEKSVSAVEEAARQDALARERQEAEKRAIALAEARREREMQEQETLRQEALKQAKEAEERKREQEIEHQRRLAAEAEVARQAEETERRAAELAASEKAREAQRQEALRQARETEERKRAQELEEQRRLSAEAEARRLAQEAEARRRVQEAELKAAELAAAERARELQRQEALRQAQEAEERKRATELEEQRRLAAEAEARKMAQEAEARKRAQEAEAQRVAAEAARQQAEAARAAEEAARQQALAREAQRQEALRQARAAEVRQAAPDAISGGSRRKTLIGRHEQDMDVVIFAEIWRRNVGMRAPFEVLEKAKTGPYENPVVTVALRSDGSVERVTITRSSGVADIDNAIRQIVMMLAPYNRFPREIAAEYDVIEIPSVWSFNRALRLIWGGG